MDDLRKGKSYTLNVNGKKKLNRLMTAAVSALTKPRCRVCWCRLLLSR